MENRTIKVYSFDELSEKAKAVAAKSVYYFFDDTCQIAKDAIRQAAGVEPEGDVWWDNVNQTVGVNRVVNFSEIDTDYLGSVDAQIVKNTGRFDLVMFTPEYRNKFRTSEFRTWAQPEEPTQEEYYDTVYEMVNRMFTFDSPSVPREDIMEMIEGMFSDPLKTFNELTGHAQDEWVKMNEALMPLQNKFACHVASDAHENFANSLDYYDTEEAVKGRLEANDSVWFTVDGHPFHEEDS